MELDRLPNISREAYDAMTEEQRIDFWHKRFRLYVRQEVNSIVIQRLKERRMKAEERFQLIVDRVKQIATSASAGNPAFIPKELCMKALFDLLDAAGLDSKGNKR